MNKKNAFISGIAGQDSSYLSEHLLSLNFEIFGIVRRKSIAEHQVDRIEHLGLENKINFIYEDLTDISSFEKIIKLSKPDEIYNLAAQSHVRISSEISQFTTQTNAIGVLNLLEVDKNNFPKAKFYQASSSEMFGNSIDKDNYQRETTRFEPTRPYGCSKVFAFNIVKHYRHEYSLFCSNGILFNQESPLRGSNFVTNKVIKTAARIKLGLEDKLILLFYDHY